MACLCRVIFFCLFTGIAANAAGQQPYCFNLNMEIGLPSNHVYGEIVDRHGYLWIATDKGVVRYNGYGFRLFNLADGLPNEDVWELTEDNDGKIWLANISDEYGYLYNDQYHKAIMKGAVNTIYPQATKVTRNGICFSSIYIHKDSRTNLCLVNNDSIYTIDNNEVTRQTGIAEEDFFGPIFIVDSNDAAVCTFKNIYYLYFRNGKLLVQRIRAMDSTLVRIFSGPFPRAQGRYANACIRGTDTAFQEDILTGRINKVSLKAPAMGEDILYWDNDGWNGFTYFISSHHIVRFRYGDSLIYEGSYPIDSLLPGQQLNGSDIRTIIWDKFWGTCISSVKNGLWINRNLENKFRKEDKFDIGGYRMLGGLPDSGYMLCSNDGHKLAMIGKNFRIKYYHSNETINIKKAAFYSKDTFLLTGQPSYLFSVATGRLIKYNKQVPIGNLFASVSDRLNTYLIGRRGFIGLDMQRNAVRWLDMDRYNDVAYNPADSSVWAYNFDKVFIHRKDRDTVIAGGQLSVFGVGKVAKIVFDRKYGNAFFNGANGITMYDPAQNRCTTLFRNINLQNACDLVYGDKLIAAGQFGVLFCRITGRMQLSAPLLYPNVKNINYTTVYDCSVMDGKVLLSTDKGIYETPVPADSELTADRADALQGSYRFIVTYRDTPANTASGDTIRMNQYFRRLQFDAINPFGNGKLRYTYRLSPDTLWHDLNANEITLPAKYIPGRYYTLYLRLHDDVWRSDEIQLHLYILPNVWQTAAGRKAAWGLAAAGIVAVLAVLVFVTRNLVLASARKRNLRMEMELKSIYAQINPHFIFNTLNVALLLVKRNRMQEAYSHITTFSRLLRSYLKSSRNKLVTIAEEIRNLKDYVELQQMRFLDKFEYEFRVQLNPEHERAVIPSLLIQPFVENAINHGILPKKGRGHLLITFRMAEDDEIICIIEDDGIGRKKSREINESMGGKEASYGDVLIKELVKVLNKYEGTRIDITYTDLDEPNTGTIVTITIKNLHHVR